jgi:hypothetical protein
MLGNESTNRDPAIYSPAFLLEEKANGNVLILRGTEQEWIEHPHDNEPRWRPFSDKVMKPVLGGYISEFNRISAFVCAVQLAARGDKATADRVKKMRDDGVDYRKEQSDYNDVPHRIHFNTRQPQSHASARFMEKRAFC